MKARRRARKEVRARRRARKEGEGSKARSKREVGLGNALPWMENERWGKNIEIFEVA